jgi:hypothetical protein
MASYIAAHPYDTAAVAIASDFIEERIQIEGVAPEIQAARLDFLRLEGRLQGIFDTYHAREIGDLPLSLQEYAKNLRAKSEPLLQKYQQHWVPGLFSVHGYGLEGGLPRKAYIDSHELLQFTRSDPERIDAFYEELQRFGVTKVSLRYMRATPVRQRRGTPNYGNLLLKRNAVEKKSASGNYAMARKASVSSNRAVAIMQPRRKFCPSLRTTRLRGGQYSG